MVDTVHPAETNGYVALYVTGGRTVQSAVTWDDAPAGRGRLPVLVRDKREGVGGGHRTDLPLWRRHSDRGCGGGGDDADDAGLVGVAGWHAVMVREPGRRV